MIILISIVVLASMVFYFSITFIKKAYFTYLYNKYPLKYEEQIKKYSQEFELDPYLVTAVIYEESRFRPDSNSSKGAVGLMQIIPQTGDYIAKKIGDKDYEISQLKDIDKNIRYGCFYLDYLSQKYDNLDKILAAYNAGEGMVDQWVGENQDLNIKYSETYQFVERVKKTKNEYEKLYLQSGRL